MRKQLRASWLGVMLIMTITFAGCYPFQGDLTLLLTPVPVDPTRQAEIQAALVNARIEAAATPESMDSEMEMASVTATVSVNALRVRQNADADSPIVAGLRQGDVVQIVGHNDDNSWLQIEIPDVDTLGWVSADFVTVEGDLMALPAPGEGEAMAETPAESEAVAEAPAESEAVAETPAESEAVAEAPAESEAVAETPAESEAVAEAPAESEAVAEAPAESEAVAETPAESEAVAEKPAEASMTMSAGESAAMTGMTSAELATVNTRSLRVRSGPADDAEIVGGALAGDTFPVAEKSDDGQWLRILFPGADGEAWIGSEFVDISETGLNVKYGNVVVNTGGPRLRVRNAATVDAEIVGYVYDGDIRYAVGVSPDGKWALLFLPAMPGATWVSAEYVTYQ